MREQKKTTRRDFLKVATTSALAAGAAPVILGRSEAQQLKLRPTRPIAPNDRVRIATIGMGIIGFIDTETALQVPGIELVAAADLYDGRLVRTKEVFGADVDTTRDYREILARDDVDAVLVCVPDHWHTKIAVDAMQAGKHVYLEKPMVHTIEEGPQILAAQEETGKVLQVGSQYVSSIIYDKAQELVAAGAIGEINLVEATMNRNSAIGAWQYSIPVDASPETIDWDTFLGHAPKREFDAVRFFRWRNYWDYGTGVAGDLYVHLFTSIHHTLQSHGPTRAFAQGMVRYWKDGRDAPDVMMGLYEYPEAATHGPFLLSLQTNFVDGGGGGSTFRFVGNEGVLTINWSSLTVERNPMSQASLQQIMEGYNSVRTFSEAGQKAFEEAYRSEHTAMPRPQPSESQEFRAPQGYDDRLDHFANFFASIREDAPNVEDAAFGYRAAAPSLLANMSYRQGKALGWDPEAMKLIA